MFLPTLAWRSDGLQFVAGASLGGVCLAFAYRSVAAKKARQIFSRECLAIQDTELAARTLKKAEMYSLAAVGVKWANSPWQLVQAGSSLPAMMPDTHRSVYRNANIRRDVTSSYASECYVGRV